MPRHKNSMIQDTACRWVMQSLIKIHLTSIVITSRVGFKPSCGINKVAWLFQYWLGRQPVIPCGPWVKSKERASSLAPISERQYQSAFWQNVATWSNDWIGCLCRAKWASVLPERFPLLYKLFVKTHCASANGSIECENVKNNVFGFV